MFFWFEKFSKLCLLASFNFHYENKEKMPTENEKKYLKLLFPGSKQYSRSPSSFKMYVIYRQFQMLKTKTILSIMRLLYIFT